MTFIEIVQNIVPNTKDWEVIKELSLLFEKAQILYRSFDVLSGGEQVKILLISLFLNYINIITKTQIEEVILKCNSTLIFVEHDEIFNSIFRK